LRRRRPIRDTHPLCFLCLLDVTVKFVRKDNPRLATVKLSIGSKQMIAEIATTPREVATGLMFRKSIGLDEGMLFVFDRPGRRSFWMKNCDLPLSAAYIGPDGKILEIHDLEPNNTDPVVS
jgi:uncharacterized membrane protein (UPF0127 family)